MASDTHEGYGKRPLVQWILIYVVIAAVLYGGYYIFADKGYNSANVPANTNSGNYNNDMNTSAPQDNNGPVDTPASSNSSGY
jgi:hypothetical protein